MRSSWDLLERWASRDLVVRRVGLKWQLRFAWFVTAALSGRAERNELFARAKPVAGQPNDLVFVSAIWPLLPARAPVVAFAALGIHGFADLSPRPGF